jgi:hypothetical protein
MDGYLSVVANKTNDVTKQLTLFASIFMPLSFVVGFFGQNFEVLGHAGFMWTMVGVVTVLPPAMVYYFSRKHGPVSDGAIAGAIESLRSYRSKVFVPGAAPHPVLPFLIERLEDSRRYPIGPGFTVEDQMRALGSLASHVRSLARGVTASPASPARPGANGGGTTRHFESISSFFDSLDFEADLDYSPEDARAAGAPEEGVRRSPGGLILPT